jgi:uncharacterized protein (DUF2252 family)
MARSAHAYVRGNTLRFYEWLASGTGKLLPHGPSVWICGDCHLGNLGPVADAHGRVKIAIRDLDQTVIGNPAHDLIARAEIQEAEVEHRRLEAAKAAFSSAN